MAGKLPRLWSARWKTILERAGWFASGIAVLAICLLYRGYVPADSAAAKPPASKVQKASASEKLKPPGNAAVAPKKNPVAAIVNNEQITREELAQECLLHFGGEVLESLVNRTLIQEACQQRNLVITDKQVEDEIDRMARKFALSKDQWLKTLEKERGVKPSRYAKDIVWPTLALRHLAKDRLVVTKQELDEAYESEFGPAVKVRLIAIDSAAKVKKIHAEACAKPEEFPALAKDHSKDINSASAYGLIQPIRRHAGDATLEETAFALKKGEISKIIKIGEMHVFVKCEEHLPPPKGINRAKVEPLLVDAIKDRKLRATAGEVFKQLQASARIDVYFNDEAKSKQMPGIAATINDQKITVRELAEECIDRHGADVLEGTINRRLLDQALRKKKITVSDQDLDAEVGRAALAMGKTKGDGQPDIEAWLQHVTKSENISHEVYLRDEVWPSTALKMLVGDAVQITQEDMDRGFKANYGPKVICRAIVVNNERRAREIWEKARENPSVKNFGDLAEQYSIEAGSRSLRGEVPPIQRYGGQPILEEEAFKLKPGNLSGIIQAGDNYIILLCEGYTKPIDTNLDEVKDLLYRDIHEKKMRLAMAQTYEALRDSAHIDNFVTGVVKAAKREDKAQRDEVLTDPGVKLPRVIKR